MNRMTRRCLPGLLVLCVPLGAGSARSDGPAEAWDRIRSTSLAPERAVRVRNLAIDMDLAVLHLDEGVLLPARETAGRTTELVFIGEGRFEMAPTDDLERAQLELFTDRSELDVAVSQAVLALGNETVVETLLDREVVDALDPDVAARAEEAFGAWVRGAERRGFGADAAILQSVLGDPLYRHFFVAWCRSEELGDFYYTLDPAEAEQITLGRFVPIEVDDLDEYRIRKQIRKAQRKGRVRQLRFEDLGDWDTWVSAPLRDVTGKPAPGAAGFESERYALDVTIDPRDESLEGEARIDVRGTVAGRRVVTLALYSDLAVRSVEDGSGKPLAWVRSDENIHVALDEGAEAGADLTLVIRWGGKALGEVQKTILTLLDTFSWYPRIGVVDRATYDVTLRWPQKFEVLASGRAIDQGMTEGGMRWERRTLEIPATAFSFEIGDYDVRHAKAGHVDLTIGFSKAAGEVDKGAKDEVVETIGKALVFLEERFGPYPLDYLTVATVPRGFSQGFLSFVTLSHYLVWRPNDGGWRVISLDEYDRPGEDRVETRRETIAHELAHQWWGNKVGWNSYRDQWLSEALADFSATLYAANEADRAAVYLARHARSWKRSVHLTTRDGRTVESLGPVVMGSRLNSSLSSQAYQAVVYDKGSVVFHMLAKALQPDPFTQMLRALADAVNNRVIETETFLSAIERMSGLDLDEFARQFIYGTGVPEVYYNYRFAPEDDGSWIVEGEARQVAPGHERFRVERTQAGTWHVRREGSESVDVRSFAMVVPFQISLADAVDETTDRGRLTRRKTTTQTGLGGAMVLEGEITKFRIPIDRKPESFWLDQRGEVLATFYCEQRQPKRMLRYRALELARTGRYEEAEALFRKALAAALLAEGATDDPPPKKEQERLSRHEDAATHIGLAEMYLDLERDADASAALDQADQLLRGLDSNRYKHARTVLRCRLNAHAGDFKAAYGELSKILFLDFPRDESLASAARRQRFRSRERVRLGGDAYALLAVTAVETGHGDVAAQALKEAEKRGADMTELKGRLPG